GPARRVSSPYGQQSGLRLPDASDPRSRSASTTRPDPPPPSPSAPDLWRPSAAADAPGDAARPRPRLRPDNRGSSSCSAGSPARPPTDIGPGDERFSARPTLPSTRWKSPTAHQTTTPPAPSAPSPVDTPADRECCYDAMTPPVWFW